MSARRFLICAAIVLSFANVASAARYQRCRDGKTLVWNSQRGVAQEATWSGLRDVKGYATGEGTLTWYRLKDVVNSYTGKMVHGKFEGLVIKEQGQTRLQAKFADGEKVGGWSEPGAVEARTPTPTATPTPKPEPPTPVATPRPQEAELLPTPIPFRSPSRSSTPRPTPIPTASPLPTPTATATPTPSPTPTSTPTPIPTARPTPTPSLTPVVTPTPTPRSTPTPSATSTLPPPQLKSLPSSPMPQPEAKTSRLEEVVDGAAHDSLVLSSPAPALRNTLEEVPPPETAAQSSASKDEMVADFKKRTESVFDQVREATEKFREVNRIDGMPALPESVATNVRSLAKQATDLREQFGYQVEFYECGVETATVAGLVAVDQATLLLTQKNAPEARLRLAGFFSRYPGPTRENQKALWQYLGSMVIAANKARADAEIRLKRAKSFEAAGKKSEALREYREIYRIYPNPITADKIKLLGGR